MNNKRYKRVIRESGTSGTVGQRPLADWLTDIRQRGGRLICRPDGRTILDIDRIDPYDHAMVTAHKAAFMAATTGQWAKWWSYATGHLNPPDWPGTYEIPWIHDPACGAVDDRMWSCATCGAPTVGLDVSTMLAWCPSHRPPACYQPSQPETAPIELGLFEREDLTYELR